MRVYWKQAAARVAPLERRLEKRRTRNPAPLLGFTSRMDIFIYIGHLLIA